MTSFLVSLALTGGLMALVVLLTLAVLALLDRVRR